MSSKRTEGRALGLLGAMIAAGLGLLTIPLFLTPPAYLDLALRDAAFGTDLTRRRVIVTDGSSGKTITADILKIGNAFVARIGRINSGNGVYTARIDGYKPGTARVQAAALQTVRVPVDLTPTFGRLEISTFNAIREDEPVAATVKEGARTVTQEPQRVVVLDLPPGRHRFSAEAPGFCPSDREFEVREGKVTKAVLPLSPDLLGNEVARFVLGWRNDPRDLDTHFWKSDARAFPSPTTVYFSQKTGVLDGKTFARLDVDEVYPGAFETLTVLDEAKGDFRYFVHVYQGSGTIADAAASVQVYTPGCRVRTLNPPRDCAFRIWNVATVRHGASGTELIDLQRCEPEGTTRVAKSAG